LVVGLLLLLGVAVMLAGSFQESWFESDCLLFLTSGLAAGPAAPEYHSDNAVQDNERVPLFSEGEFAQKTAITMFAVRIHS